MIKAHLAKAAKKYFLNIGAASVMCLASTQMASADWRSDMGVFRIGIATNYGEPFKLEQFEPFRIAISEALNMPVEFFQARDASSLIDATASQRIEYAIISAVGYATLDLMCSCVQPLAAPVSADGATSVRSALVVNPQTIKTLDDLPGKKIAIGPNTSLTGNLIPLHQFSVGGKNLKQLGVELVTTGDAEEATKLFLAGDVDAFFGWQSAAKDKRAEFTSLMGEHLKRFPQSAVATLWLSNPIRYGPHAVRKNVPREAIQTLQKVLKDLEDETPLGYDAVVPDLAGGMVEVTRNHYETARALVRSIARDGNIDAELNSAPGSNN